METIKTCLNCKYEAYTSISRPCISCFDVSNWKESYTPGERQAVAKYPDKTKSDGGSSTYYDIPEGSVTLNDIIEAQHMSFARGNIFKAVYRLDKKQGTDIEYDLNKIIYFAERLKRMARLGVPL